MVGLVVDWVWLFGWLVGRVEMGALFWLSDGVDLMVMDSGQSGGG